MLHDHREMLIAAEKRRMSGNQPPERRVASTLRPAVEVGAADANGRPPFAAGRAKRLILATLANSKKTIIVDVVNAQYGLHWSFRCRVAHVPRNLARDAGEGEGRECPACDMTA
jgi:hypothetical protein